MNRFWRHEGTQERYRDPVLTIEHRRYRFTKIDKAMDFTVINTADWVVIVPIREDGRFVLVRQYRVGSDSVTYEFPGGAINRGEDPEKAAHRELAEETGHAGTVSPLGVIAPNPPLMSNSCHVYLAEGCRAVAPLETDEFEDIELVYVSPEELQQMVADGAIHHSIVLAAYARYLVVKK